MEKSSSILVAVIALASLLGNVRQATADELKPYETGPYPNTHLFLDSLLNSDLSEDVDVWVPTTEGTYPVMYFLDSFGGITPGDAYSELFTHVASHGIAVILPWSLSLPVSPLDKVPIFEDVMDWVDNNMENKMHENGVPEGVKLELSKVFLSGHSAGNHVLVEYIKAHCGKVIGQALLSPVDGFDPLGLVPIFCITPGEFLNYATPTLHLSVGYDPVPGSSGVACAPEKLSNARFYNAMDPQTTPKWTINATRFGHADLLDDSYIDTVQETKFCGVNEDLTEEEHVIYRKFAGGQIVVFIKGLLEEDEEECENYMQYLQDADLMPVEVISDFSKPTTKCPKAFCEWYPPSD